MNKIHVFLLVILNAILLVSVIVLFSFYKKDKTNNAIVYIDNIKLFNGFNMAKDLSKLNTGKINKQKKKLDSLYTIYSIFSEQKNLEKAKELEVQLRAQDQELQKMNEHFSKEVSQQVWNRLNTYIKEYGETKQYKIVLGTQGTGNIMYGAAGIDITEAILDYANTKYEGN